MTDDRGAIVRLAAHATLAGVGGGPEAIREYDALEKIRGRVRWLADAACSEDGDCRGRCGPCAARWMLG